MQNKEPSNQQHLQGGKEREQNPFQSVLYCHVGLLPQPSLNEAAKKQIRVLIHGHGRDNALAKDSKWVSDRKQYTTCTNEQSLCGCKNAEKSVVSSKTASSSASTITASKSSPFEEIILTNDKGELLEGTQTNFYVVKNATNLCSSITSSSSKCSAPTIITANEGILHGSVRDSVLRVCLAHNVTLELRPPTLEDLQHASGVFLTSTSRWVMPVNEVVLGDLLLLNTDDNSMKDGKHLENGGLEGGITIEVGSDTDRPSSYYYSDCPITENIRKWVLDDVLTHSTSIYSNA